MKEKLIKLYLLINSLILLNCFESEVSTEKSEVEYKYNILKAKKLNSKYHYHKILLNSEKELDLPNSECFSIRVNQLFQNLKLKIEGENIEKMIITNQKLQDLDSQYPNCNKNFTLCNEYIYPSKIKYSSRYCDLSTYIYGCIGNSTNSTSSASLDLNSTSKFKIKTYLNKPLEDENGLSFTSCVAIKPDINSNCASLGNRCIEDNYCVNKCEQLSCNLQSLNSANSNSTSSENYKLCIPKGINDTEKLDVCSSFYPKLENNESVVFNSISCNSKISKFENRTKIFEEQNITELESKENRFYKLLSILIGVFIIILLLSSLYYRVKLKNEGVPPFHPPDFMPGFLFPKPRKEDVLI